MTLRLSEARIESEAGKQLVEWLQTYKFFNPKKIEVASNKPDVLRVKLYTDRHVFAIVARADYLGCVASTTKPRPGEDWTRGSDLPDGDFSRDTFRSILGAIVLYGLLEVVQPEHTTASTELRDAQ